MKYLSILILILFCSSAIAQKKDFKILNELIEDKNSEYSKIDAILVEKGGKLIVEKYFNGYDKEIKHDMRSSFKSVTSILVGIAIDKGLFSLDDNLSKFFPELKNNEKGEISVRNLLEMKSGINCEEFYGIGPMCEDEMDKTQDWISYCLGLDMLSKPGLNWSYNSIDPMLLGEVIARVSGESVMEFAKENLFEKLNIKDYKWTISPIGQGMTAGSFYITPFDMLKLINLVANKGFWNGKQVVSSQWIDLATECKVPIDFSFVRYSRMQNARYESARYGFYWYKENLSYDDINTEVLFASGNGGQYMMYLPEYDLKVIFTGSNYNNWRGKLPFEILLKYLLPII